MARIEDEPLAQWQTLRDRERIAVARRVDDRERARGLCDDLMSVPAASRVLSGSGIAPARIDPKKNSMNSVRFPISMATRSPGATPSRASMLATPFMRASSCR